MSVLLIRRRRPIGEPAPADPSPASGDRTAPSTLEGVAGAGRVAHALVEVGVSLEGVEQLVLDAAAPPADLRDLDLGRRFDTVVLGSHLVNLPDDDARAAFVDLARRHAAPDGAVLVEHHPIDWAETAAEVRATPGGTLGMVEVRRNPPFVSAVAVYDVGGRVVRQPFTARVLSEAQLASELAACGLIVRRRLSLPGSRRPEAGQTNPSQPAARLLTAADHLRPRRKTMPIAA